jgi:hypothetical protein
MGKKLGFTPGVLLVMDGEMAVAQANTQADYNVARV